MDHPTLASAAGDMSVALPWMMRFVATENCRPLLKEGFSVPEADFVWMTGSVSRMILPPIDSVDDLWLRIVVNRPGGSPLITRQIVVIRANGHLIGRFRIEQMSMLTCEIRRDQYEPLVPIVVTIEHPCFLRTDRLGNGKDDRPLAVSLLKVCVSRLGDVDNPPTKLWLRRGAPAEHDLVAPWPNEPARSVESVMLRFAPGSADLAALADGWTFDDTGCPITCAKASRIAVPAPAARADHMLRLALEPLLIHRLRPQQRLTVVVNGAVVGQFSLVNDTEITMPIPAELWIDRPIIDVILLCPDAVSLNDFDTDVPEQFLGFTLDWLGIEPVPPHLGWLARQRTDELVKTPPIAGSAAFLGEPLDRLDPAVTQALGIGIADMLRNFESLGNNCAFGLAQRKGGAEILGLLRFANTPFKSLVTALADSFAAVRNPANIDIRLADSGEPREFMAFIEQYGIRWHTMVHEDVAKLEDISAEQITKLVYLQRRFVSGLTANRKIYVFGNYDPDKVKIAAPSFNAPVVYEEAPRPLGLAEAVSAFLHLNQLGRNTLLYVVPCRGGHRSGSAELVLPGVIRGYLDSFVISADTEIHDHADWLRLCANAWVLDKGANTSFRAG
jgi:hypothetical protein